MEKPFKTYDEQMDYLRKSKNIEVGEQDKGFLVRNGYFNLVNGYKTPFIEGFGAGRKHVYLPNTRLIHLVHAKNFDEELSNLLMKYLKKVEQEVRVTFIYKFDEHNDALNNFWNNPEAFDQKESNQERVIDLIKKINDELKESKLSYLKHYRSKHEYIPSWIMAKCIKFSSMVDFINLSPKAIKIEFANLYGIEMIERKKDGREFYNDSLLKSGLNWIRIVRNACAHNERVYGLKKPNSRVRSKYHQILGKKYYYGKDLMLIDVFIYLKYFLPAEEYAQFINQIYALLTDLKDKIDPKAFVRIRNKMGIHDISDLMRLLESPNLIDFSNYP